MIDRNLILCDGLPGYLYAKSLQMCLPRHVQSAVSVVQAIHQENNSFELIKAAESIRRQSVKDRDPYKRVCVLTSRPQCNDVKIRTLLENQFLTAAYCPICIEQWYMLHFEEYDPNIICQDESIERLSFLWPQYKRNQVDAYEDLKDRIPIALNRAASAKNSVFEAQGDTAPVFTIERLFTFFDSINDAA